MQDDTTTADESDDQVESIERRALLWLPLACAATGAAAFGAPLVARGEDEAVRLGLANDAFTPLGRDELERRWNALADALRGAPAEHDESYAAQLASLVARVPLDALPRLDRALGERVFVAGVTWALAHAVTVEFRMAPGAVLRTHNHPPQVVLTLCAEGEVAYRHFEPDGDAPPCTQVDGRRFAVRETRSGVLRARQTTSLTRTRDGIHGFVAGPHGARIIDFTLGLTADTETFSYLDVSAAPTDPARRVYGAAWLGKAP